MPLYHLGAVQYPACCTQPCLLHVQGHEALWRDHFQWRPADQAAQTPDWVCDAGLVTCTCAVSHTKSVEGLLTACVHHMPCLQSAAMPEPQQCAWSAALSSFIGRLSICNPFPSRVPASAGQAHAIWCLSCELPAAHSDQPVFGACRMTCCMSL